MEFFIDIASFFGSWLLVAGPIFQASLELSDQDIEFDRIHEVRKSLPPPRKVSPWWWLFPPAKLYLSHKASDEFKQAYLHALNDEDVQALMDIRSKALGWVMVATGGLLLACKETYELWVHFSLPLYFYGTAVIFMVYASLLFTIISARRRRKLQSPRGTAKNS